MAIPTHRPRAALRFGPTALIVVAGLTGSAVGGEPLRVRSEVPALAIVATREIPEAPPSAAERAFCEHLTVRPVTEAGRLVAGRGWAVTGEVPLASGAQAVAFAGRFEQGTSGSCLVSEGNVAIVRDGAVLAIAYAPRGAKDTIGKVVPFGEGQVRIWSGDYLRQPIADLRVEDRALTLLPLAAEEALCGGRAIVPNVYGMPIDQARKRLEAAGWTPMRGAKPPPGSREADLVKRGIVEVESCSGTGFGFCAYGYRGSAGTLSVSTVGDDEYPTVSGYDAACR